MKGRGNKFEKVPYYSSDGIAGNVIAEYQIGDLAVVAARDSEDVVFALAVSGLTVDGFSASKMEALSHSNNVALSLTPQQALLLGKSLLLAARWCGERE